MKNKLFTTGAVIAAVLVAGCSDGRFDTSSATIPVWSIIKDISDNRWEICVDR